MENSIFGVVPQIGMLTGQKMQPVLLVLNFFDIRTHFQPKHAAEYMSSWSSRRFSFRKSTNIKMVFLSLLESF